MGRGSGRGQHAAHLCVFVCVFVRVCVGFKEIPFLLFFCQHGDSVFKFVSCGTRFVMRLSARTFSNWMLLCLAVASPAVKSIFAATL